jgi:hypothetical protein
VLTAPTGLPLKPWRRRSIKTTSATVAHAIAVNILDPSLSPNRLGAVDAKRSSRRPVRMQGKELPRGSGPNQRDV